MFKNIAFLCAVVCAGCCSSDVDLAPGVVYSNPDYPKSLFGSPVDGTITKYYVNGRKAAEEKYENGILLYHFIWYPNGQKREEFFCKDGKKTGWVYVWYEDGTLRCQEWFEQGEANGIYLEWYNNGVLWFRHYNKNGNRDGEYRIWHENGKPEVITQYKNGEIDGAYTELSADGEILEESFHVDGKEKWSKILDDDFKDSTHKYQYFIDGKKVTEKEFLEFFKATPAIK